MSRRRRSPDADLRYKRKGLTGATASERFEIAARIAMVRREKVARGERPLVPALAWSVPRAPNLSDRASE